MNGIQSTAKDLFEKFFWSRARDFYGASFIYNFMAIGFYGFTWATLFSVGYTSSFLGANIGLAIVLMAISAIPFYLCTAMLSSAMPRAGGDYVAEPHSASVRLVLHPLYPRGLYGSGDFASFLGVVMTTIGFQPLYALLGLTNSGDATLQAPSLRFGQDNNTLVFEITTLIIILGFAVAALGIRFYVRLQYVPFAGSAISAITLLGVLATTSHQAFISNFNAFTLPLVQAGNQTQVSTANVTAVGGYYQYIINTAALQPSTFSLWIPCYFSELSGFPLDRHLSAFFYLNLGRMKGLESASPSDHANRVCPNFCRVFARVVVFARIRDWVPVPAGVFQSVWAVQCRDQSSCVSVPHPTIRRFVASISTSPAVWGLILVGATFGIFQVILIVYFASTRIMLAVLAGSRPSGKPAYVSSKTHSPIVALVVSAIGCEAFLYLIIYQYMSLSYFSTPGLATQIAYVLISVTAILFPFRKKQIYEASPAAKYRSEDSLYSLSREFSRLFSIY